MDERCLLRLSFLRTLGILSSLMTDTYPQLLHHRPRRPRQIHPGRPAAASHRHRPRPRHHRADPRFDGPGTREGRHHQGLRRAHELHCQRRQHLRTQPDRHPRPCGFRLRGQPGAERLRRRGAGGGRHPGHRSPDPRQPVLRPRSATWSSSRSSTRSTWSPPAPTRWPRISAACWVSCRRKCCASRPRTGRTSKRCWKPSSRKSRRPPARRSCPCGR